MADDLHSGMVERDIMEALCDSAYLAGLLRGWNLGLFEDAEGYARIVKNYEGYLAPIIAKRRRLAANPARNTASPSLPEAPEPT